MAIALSIIAGYIIYLITIEIPSIKKRIALNGYLSFSIKKVKSDIEEFLQYIKFEHKLEEIRPHIPEIENLDLNKLFELKQSEIQWFEKQIATKSTFY